MNANKRRLYFSLFTLTALIVVAYLTAKRAGMFDEKVSTNDSPFSEFAIKDTAMVDQFVITKSTGEKATLSKGKNGFWMINNKARAKPESISLILKTFKNISVKSRVGAAARENVIKNIAGYHRKVEIYSNGEIVKTWYVGNPTADRQGTYMLLETPEDGRSKEPYIMELAAFHGQLDVRFFTEEEDWKYTAVFTYKPDEIKEIKLESFETPDQSFTITNTGKALGLLDKNGAKVANYDTLTVRSYLYNFKKIHYEHSARMLTYQKLDSLKKSTPFVHLTVTNSRNEKELIKIYRMPNFAKIEDLEGTVLKYNPERAYALLPNGDMVVVQYYVFDKILRPLSSFIRKQANL